MPVVSTLPDPCYSFYEHTCSKESQIGQGKGCFSQQSHPTSTNDDGRPDAEAAWNCVSIRQAESD